MVDPISLTISGSSLVLSSLTAWFTLFRRGAVRMTQPTIICFKAERGERKEVPKIFLRSLLYSTAKRGVVIENMYIKLNRGKHNQVFSIWAHGDKDLVRGSGLYVGEQGVACNHHFLPCSNDEDFTLSQGDYIIQVFVSLVGWKKSLKLSEVNLLMSKEHLSLLTSQEAAIWFDWEPNSRRYVSQILSRPGKAQNLSSFRTLFL